MNSLKRMMIEGFGSNNSQVFHLRKTNNGLWLAEEFFVKKYWKKTDAKILDVGCGTGRTSFPLEKLGYKVTAIDIVPNMIKNAKKLAKEKKSKIKFDVMDATRIKFKNDVFDYVIFSNQGWTQIPGKEERLKAIKGIYRVMKKDGIFMFSVHLRDFNPEFFGFWFKQWIKQFILKPSGFKIKELDYGDRIFFKENDDKSNTYEEGQYVHIPSRKYVRKELRKAGFNILEENREQQISKEDMRKHPPIFFICKK